MNTAKVISIKITSCLWRNIAILQLLTFFSSGHCSFTSKITMFIVQAYVLSINDKFVCNNNTLEWINNVIFIFNIFNGTLYHLWYKYLNDIMVVLLFWYFARVWSRAFFFLPSRQNYLSKYKHCLNLSTMLIPLALYD